MYISHMRSEGNRLLEAIDEADHDCARGATSAPRSITSRRRDESNWGKMDAAIAKIEGARTEGVEITADMYTYTAGCDRPRCGDAAMGAGRRLRGVGGTAARPEDSRSRAGARCASSYDDWENLMLAAGGDRRRCSSGSRTKPPKQYTGKTLAEVAKCAGQSLQDTAMDLVVEDGSRVQVVYFLMSEDNVKRQIQLPWVSFGSDAASMAPEGVFMRSSTHPRAYGNFARAARQVRPRRESHHARGSDSQTDALPGGQRCGSRSADAYCAGQFADIVVFDPGRFRPRNVREAAPVRDRHEARVGQRRAGAARRRAYRRQARTGRARTWMEASIVSTEYDWRSAIVSVRNRPLPPNRESAFRLITKGPNASYRPGRRYRANQARVVVVKPLNNRLPWL